MATNLLPPFTDRDSWYVPWSCDEVSVSEHDWTLDAYSTWDGPIFSVPSDWIGKELVMGCTSISSNAGLYVQDVDTWEEIAVVEGSTLEVKFTIPQGTFAEICFQATNAIGHISITGAYIYLASDTGGDEGGGGSDGEVVEITLRPISASGSNWTNVSTMYDNSTSTGAEVSATYSNYGSRVLTCNFDTSSIPSNAIITSATLEVTYAQSSSTSSRIYTPYFDINGDSSKRVLSKQLTSVSMYEETVDITSHMSSLKTITITPYRVGTSGTNVLTIFDMKIVVNYQVPPTIKNVFLGSTKIADIYLGKVPISRVFLGNILIFGSSSSESYSTVSFDTSVTRKY